MCSSNTALTDVRVWGRKEAGERVCTVSSVLQRKPSSTRWWAAGPRSSTRAEWGRTGWLWDSGSADESRTPWRKWRWRIQIHSLESNSSYVHTYLAFKADSDLLLYNFQFLVMRGPKTSTFAFLFPICLFDKQPSQSFIKHSMHI